MRLTKVEDRYVLICGFDDRVYAKEAGFRWNPDRAEWWTDSRENAAKLVQCADETCAAELGATRAAAVAVLDASRAQDADVDVPAPEGRAYMGFQKAGILYCLRVFGDL